MHRHLLKKFSGKNQSHESERRSGEMKRLHFKSSHGGGGRHDRAKDWSASLRAHLDDENVDMRVSSSNADYKTRRYGRGDRRDIGRSPVHRRQYEKRRLREGPIGWYRIFVPYGNKYDKQFIQREMQEKLDPTPLIPVMWTEARTGVTFYVDDYKTAEKLNNIDRDIKLPDGFRLILKVASGSPDVDITLAIKEKMEQAMWKRYNSLTNALDLTRFHLDPDLLDIFCGLVKPNILLAVIDLISENIPRLEALNLNDNKIQLLSHLKKIHLKLPNLKILYIGTNQLRDISQLNYLNGLPLVELVLQGNPLCVSFDDQPSYASAVRNKIPKVIKLDGIDLPPPICFDIDVGEVNLPNSLHTFVCNSNSLAFVKQFIEQYFQVMDSGNREPLLQAYHADAVFSMTMSYPYEEKPNTSPSLSWYRTDNRNLVRVSDSDRRFQMLKQGCEEIVAFLREMPHTTHDFESFTLDMCISTPQMILATVTGFFKELQLAHKSPPIRYFFRTFVLVPAGDRCCLVNEQLHVSNATEQQLKVAFKTAASAPMAEAPPVVPSQVGDGTPDSLKQQMIESISSTSGMNVLWAERCLSETNWDFARAGEVFRIAKEQGVIPQEAFIK